MIDCSIPRYRLDPIEWVPWHVFLVAISLWNDASLCDNESFAIRFIAHVFDKHPEAVCCLITRIPCSGHNTRDQLVRFAASISSTDEEEDVDWTIVLGLLVGRIICLCVLSSSSYILLLARFVSYGNGFCVSSCILCQ